METSTNIGKLSFAIDPFREAVAYETLLALKGSSESKLEREFPSSSSALIRHQIRVKTRIES